MTGWRTWLVGVMVAVLTTGVSWAGEPGAASLLDLLCEIAPGGLEQGASLRYPETALKISARPAAGITPLRVQLDAQVADEIVGTDARVVWQISRKKALDGESPAITLSACGSHCITASLVRGDEVLAQRSIVVTVLPPTTIAMRRNDDATMLTLEAVPAREDAVPAEATWRWDFGDGVVLLGKRVTRRIPPLAQVGVSLSLLLGGMQIGCSQAAIDVAEREGLIADAGPDLQLTAESGRFARVELDAASTSGQARIVRYRWLLGDRLIAESDTAAVTVMLPPGEYLIRLEVVDAQGNVASDVTRVVVQAAPGAGRTDAGPPDANQPPGEDAKHEHVNRSGDGEPPVAADAGADQQVLDSDADGWEVVVLDASASSGQIVSYRWLAADGRLLAESPGPLTSVLLPVGTHQITLEAVGIRSSDRDDTQVAVQPAPWNDCADARPNWQNFPAPSRNGRFTVRYLATPHDSGMDGLFALSRGAGSTYSDYAVLVRFSTAGRIDARDGDVYRADTQVSYQPGQTYVFRLVVDVAAGRYDVFVTSPDGIERQVAAGFAFRTEQAGVAVLDNWAIQAGIGTWEVCSVTFGDGELPPPMPPVADAGGDITVDDQDGDGVELVMLDASGSYDPDGQVVNYRWSEGDQVLWLGPQSRAGVELGVGQHVLTLRVTDTDGLQAEDTLLVTVRAGQPGGRVTMLGSVTRNGITWTFDQQYPVGRFVNGDYYVIGPVTITAISPAPAGGRNGSMVDPPIDDVQAYDSRAYNYDPGRVVTPPLVLQPGQSLVSTASCDDAQFTFLESAAVLTCLSAAVPEDTFRPPYVAGDKPLYSAAGLHLELLPSLPPVAAAPDPASLAAALEPVWLDHQPGWHGRFIHPRSNMPDYGREIATCINDAALMVLLDLPADQKRLLVIRLVQLGIDFNGIADAGGGWTADGGHASGRKWPILFAGLMLGDQHLLSIGRRDVDFGEDCQTFYVTQADVDRGVGYTADELNMPEWGIRHCFAPQQDTPDWNASYRQCCTANAWVGAVLAARLLGMEQDWNHPALFDYQDRFMNMQPPGQFRAWSSFAESMWDTYR